MQRLANAAKRLGGLLVAGLLMMMPTTIAAQDLRGQIETIVKEYLASHPDEVAGIVKDYMIQHPEMVGQILGEILKRRAGAAAAGNGAPAGVPGNGATAGAAPAAPARAAAIAANAGQLLSSPHQVTLGNPDGDVTLVEFFDYSCGYCKRALPDLLALIKDDPRLKIVLKEFPILGPGSTEAARVAIAVRMQDPTGAKYLAFHQQLLATPGPASRDKALAAAQQAGLDMARLTNDMGSDEIAATLTEDAGLARTLGATGTPTYVVGKDVVVGAIGVAGLKDRIDGARRQAAN